MQTNPLDKPNRRTVEQLFRELLTSSLRERDELEAEYDKARDLERALEEHLLDNKRLKLLRKRRERAYVRLENKRRRIKDAVRPVKDLYLANGLTESVLAKINRMLVQVERIKAGK